MSMNWRLASRLSVVIFAILAVIFVLVFQQIRSSITTTVSSVTNGVSFAGLQGTDLGGTPAPNFQLTDQNGQTVSLSQFKGKPVVLTFLYTNCPDLCPLTAEKLHQTMLALGNQAHQVGVIAVTVDPKRDTQQAALTFSQLHRMQGYWHYLIGTQQQLTPTWSNYNISAQPGQSAGTIDHSLGIYVIDKQGRERAFFDTSFEATQLTADLQTLLKQ